MTGGEVVELFRRVVAARPFPYGERTAARAMALLWFVGGVTTLLVVALPHPPGLREPVLLVIGATSPVVAVVILRLRERLPSSAYPWLLAAGTFIVTVLVASGGGGSASVSLSFFYVWVIIYAVLFFRPAVALLHFAGVLTAYAATLSYLRAFGAGSFTAVEPTVLVAVMGTTAAVVLQLSAAREASELDPLTGVANRRGLDRILDAELSSARGSHDPGLVVAIIDVDHFKRINDRDGHQAGDQVLRDLADHWRSQLRAGDTIARFGGDEFVVVLPSCDLVGATAIVERLRVSGPAGTTCSVGLAELRPGDTASLLVSRADAALYDAKRLGRDQLACAS